jgi:hypothetical protein
MRRVARTAAALLLLLTVIPACRKAQREARVFEPCAPERPCELSLRCLPGPGEKGPAGTCVKLCQADADCGAPLACSGRVRLATGPERFCRRPARNEGQSCSAPEDGCGPGLACFRGRCAKSCAQDGDCPAAADRCLTVILDSLVDREPKPVDRVCLPAAQRDAEPCGERGPFCARSHECNAGRCLQTCRADADCGEGRRCDGSLFLGAGAAERVKASQAPDTRFCRQVRKAGQSCHYTLNQTCQAGLACVEYRCQKVRTAGPGERCDPPKALVCDRGALCHEARCRKTCQTEADCAEDGGRGGVCVTEVVQGKGVKLCR